MLENDLWLAEKFTMGQAWVDLIGHANHKPGSLNAFSISSSVILLPLIGHNVVYKTDYALLEWVMSNVIRRKEMDKFLVVKTEYEFVGGEEGEDNFSISICEDYDLVLGRTIVLKQDGKDVRFPAAFADVIKEWAKGEKA